MNKTYKIIPMDDTFGVSIDNCIAKINNISFDGKEEKTLQIDYNFTDYNNIPEDIKNYEFMLSQVIQKLIEEKSENKFGNK